LVNSSTNSGTPSVRSTIWPTTSSGNALPPAICSTKAVRSCRSSRLSVSMLTWGWPVQGIWNSGRNVTINSTGRMRTAAQAADDITLAGAGAARDARNASEIAGPFLPNELAPSLIDKPALAASPKG
jgi:hypothetical protein